MYYGNPRKTGFRLGLGQYPLRPGDGTGSGLREPLHLQNRQEVVSRLKLGLKQKHISDRMGEAGREGSCPPSQCLSEGWKPCGYSLPESAVATVSWHFKTFISRNQTDSPYNTVSSARLDLATV